MRSWWWAASLALSAAAAAQPGLPPHVEIEYELKRNGSVMADVVDRLEQANGSYALSEHWKGKGVYALMGKAKRSSAGSLGAGGPRPREFVDERSGRDTQRVSFDWQAQTITRRYKGDTRTESVPGDTQDRLSFLLALSFASRASQPVSFHVADARGMSHHAYAPAGRERVATPAGEFEAIKVIRQNDDPGESAQFWFAVSRGYLPVRILVVEKDGTRFEHLAKRIEP
jgi:hypothetical protein